jgi:hypothetical protein
MTILSLDYPPEKHTLLDFSPYFLPLNPHGYSYLVD